MTIGARDAVALPSTTAFPFSTGFPKALLCPAEPNALPAIVGGAPNTLFVVGPPNADDPNAFVVADGFPNADVLPAPKEELPKDDDPNADPEGGVAPNADVLAGDAGAPKADVVAVDAEFPNAEEPNGDVPVGAPKALGAEDTEEPKAEGAPNVDADPGGAGTEDPNADDAVGCIAAEVEPNGLVPNEDP